jgi:hypothetical protein
MLTIRNNKIIDAKGTVLKTVFCPKQMTDADLKSPNAPKSQCTHCDRDVINTDYMTEPQIIEKLKEDPATCLKINLYNPIFKVIDQEPDDGI